MISLIRKGEVKQKYDWDCGLACVSTIFNVIFLEESCGKEGGELVTLEKTVKEFNNHLWGGKIPPDIGNPQVWTIFLFEFISECWKFDAFFFTKVFGATHSENEFYKDYFGVFEKKVNDAFGRIVRKSSSGGETKNRLFKKEISSERMKKLLRSNLFYLVVLVNHNQLKCTVCEKNKRIVSKYVGHYIVVLPRNYYDGEEDVGGEEDCVLYWNPSNTLTCFPCRTSFGMFEEARTHECTDDDIILIPRNPKNIYAGEKFVQENLL